jgi:hypothetical protein
MTVKKQSMPAITLLIIYLAVNAAAAIAFMVCYAGMEDKTLQQTRDIIWVDIPRSIR